MGKKGWKVIGNGAVVAYLYVLLGLLSEGQETEWV
jgi:hypothetical protein